MFMLKKTWYEIQFHFLKEYSTQQQGTWPKVMFMTMIFSRHLDWDNTDMQYFFARTILLDNHDRPQQVRNHSCLIFLSFFCDVGGLC